MSDYIIPGGCPCGGNIIILAEIYQDPLTGTKKPRRYMLTGGVCQNCLGEVVLSLEELTPKLIVELGAKET